VTEEDAIRSTVSDYFEGWFEGRPLGWNERSTRAREAVTEIHRGIATVVVHSQGYREYLHLARTDDGWKIVNGLWDLT
jgi:hypothetical protein